MDSIKIFPDYFSQEAIDQITFWGKMDNIHVYRVGKNGKLADAFYNYYEEVILGLKKVRNIESTLKKYQNDIDSLSVSCYHNINDIRYYYSITLKEDYPKRILLEGTTSPEYGLASKTKDRKPNKQDSHVDYWLYQNATPWETFKEIELDDE